MLLCRRASTATKKRWRGGCSAKPQTATSSLEQALEVWCWSITQVLLEFFLCHNFPDTGRRNWLLKVNTSPVPTAAAWLPTTPIAKVMEGWGSAMSQSEWSSGAIASSTRRWECTKQRPWKLASRYSTQRCWPAPWSTNSCNVPQGESKMCCKPKPV